MGKCQLDINNIRKHQNNGYKHHINIIPEDRTRRIRRTVTRTGYNSHVTIDDDSCKIMIKKTTKLHELCLEAILLMMIITYTQITDNRVQCEIGHNKLAKCYQYQCVCTLI